MKKKNILLTILNLILITILSLGSVVIIKNQPHAQVKETISSDQLLNRIDDYMKTLIYDVAMDFNINDDEKPIENYVDATVVRDYQNNISDLRRDPNINFLMKYNGTTVRSNTAEFELNDKWSWFVSIEYDEKGICRSKSSDGFDFCKYVDFYYHYPKYDENANWKPEIVLENPSNMSFVFALPKEFQPHGIFFNELIGDYYVKKDAVVGIVVLTVAFLLFAYMMLMPYSWVSQVQPFKSLSKLKLLIHVVVLGVMLTYMTVGTVEVAHLMVRIYDVNLNLPIIITPQLVEAGSVVYFMVYYCFMLWAFFMVKAILKTGIFKYLKENTYLGSLVRATRLCMNEYATFDLADETNKKVFKFAVLNLIILFFVTLIPGFNLIFVVLYSIGFYYFAMKKLKEIQEDYSQLLSKTKRVSQGDFTKNENSNYGYFQSLGDEFDHIQEGFEKAVNEEVKSSKLKTELISNVSHDLKTPLTSIITYVDLMKKEDLSAEERQDYLAILDRNSLRLKHLIDDLFEVSKVNSGDVKLDLVEVDLVSLMNQTIFENEDQLAQKNLDVRFTKNSEKMMMICDSLKTYRIFENLLNNIAKYALSNTRVYISLEENEHEIIASFKNISENEMNFDADEIMDRFVRGDKSRNSEGSGLGLAIVKSFTEVQNASFNIETDGDLFKAIVTFKKQG